jgi:hypothetical protein
MSALFQLCLRRAVCPALRALRTLRETRSGKHRDMSLSSRSEEGRPSPLPSIGVPVGRRSFHGRAKKGGVQADLALERRVSLTS